MTHTGIRLGLIAMVVVAALAGASARQATAAKKGYFIAEVDVTNPQQYGEYAKLSPGVIEKFGGRFIARGGQVASLEGAAAAPRVVIVEFPSFERAQQFYNSPDYQTIRKLRVGAANFRGVLVEGL
ncbi:MAG: DUF1330 domain-containing protein [Vicinamibacterales bacterium]